MQRTTLYLIGLICFVTHTPVTHAASANANASATAPTTTAADIKAAAAEKDRKAGSAAGPATNIVLPGARIKDISKCVLVRTPEQLREHCQNVALRRQLTTVDDISKLYDACSEVIDTVYFAEKDCRKTIIDHYHKKNDGFAARSETFTDPVQQMLLMLFPVDFCPRHGTYIVRSDTNRHYKTERDATSTTLQSIPNLPKELWDVVADYFVVPGVSALELQASRLARNVTTPRGIEVFVVKGINTTQGIQNASSARILEISYSYLCEIEKPLVEFLQQNQITTLCIGSSPLWKVDLHPLTKCPQLQVLLLSGNDIEEIIGLNALIPQLNSLSLHENRLRADQVKEIQALWAAQGKPANNLQIAEQQQQTPDGWLVYLEDRLQVKAHTPSRPFREKRPQPPVPQPSPKPD